MSNRIQNIAKRVRDAFGNFYEKIHGYIIKPGAEVIVGDAPTIIRFESSTNFIDGSRPVRLSWQVEHADRIVINGENVTGLNYIDVNPSSDTTYVLTASNQYDIEGDLSDPILVRVDQTPPYIHYFRVKPELAKEGEPVEITWQVVGAASLEIEGIGQVQGNSYLFTPRRDTVLTLRATSFAGVHSSARTGVEVDKSPPIIHRFDAAPTILPDARPVRITWETEGAELVRVPGFGDFPPSGETELAVRGDMIINFLAVSHYGITASAQTEIITSKEPPVIRAFKTNRLILSDATPAKLFWDVENAVRIEIDNGIGEVTGLPSQAVHAMTDKVYTLTAWSYFGILANASLKISIDRTPPQIKSFKSDKEFVFVDNNIHLYWDAPEAYQLTLYPAGNAVDKSGSFETTIRRDTMFRLVAANYFGIENHIEVLIRVLPIPIIETLWVPAFSLEEKIHVEYSRIDPSQLPTNIIQFNNSLLIESFRITELNLDAFTPPLEVQYKTLTDMIRQIYQDHILVAFERIKQIIREKMETNY